MNGYNFTERVRKVLNLARREAERRKHENLGTEHILLAVIEEGKGVAVAALQSLQINLDTLKQNIDEILEPGPVDLITGPDLPYTIRAKKVLELAMDAARDLDHDYVGTEHLLLGLIREERGIAAQALRQAGLTEDSVRAAVRRVLGVTGDAEQTRFASKVVSVWVEVGLADGSTVRNRFPNAAAAIGFLSQP